MKMNLFVAFTTFAVLIMASSWNVDCAPNFPSAATFTSTTNDGPPIALTVINGRRRVLMK